MNKIITLVKNKLNAQGGFLKSVSILLGGSTFAQLLTIATLPIITRLYTPEQFSVFAIYVSMLSILSAICCLRFEIAIPITQDDKEAIRLSLLATASNLIFTAILCIIIACFSEIILTKINKKEILEYIWLLPIGVFLTGIYTTFQYWATRQKQYVLIAKTNIIQSALGALTQIVIAFLNYGVLGLILGQVIKSSAGGFKLFTNFLKDNISLIRKENLAQIKQTFYNNKQFPKYSIWDALANSASIHIPIIVIATLTTGSEVGFLMLAMQILAIPITFIGRSVSQVYLVEASQKVQDREVSKFTIEVIDKLFIFGVNLLVLIGVFSPKIVQYVFGSEWEYMGELISWMIPWFIFQLISSPISMIMHIMKKQRELLVLTLLGFFIKIGTVYMQSNINSECLLEAFSISNAIFYSICLVVFLKVAKVNFFELVMVLKNRIITSGTLLFVCIIFY